MKINKRLVCVLLIIAFTIGLVSGIKPLLVLYLGGVTAIQYALNPLTLFTASFRLGRSLDVKAELRTTIISIYLGCFIGRFVGYQLGYSIVSFVAYGGVAVLYNVLWGALTTLVSAIGLFFASFSAISIASFMKCQARPNTPLDNQYSS